MTLPALVAASQVLSAMAWLMVTHHYLPSLYRVARAGLARRIPWIDDAPPLQPWDGAGCWAAIIGLVQTAFSVRWIALGTADVADMARPSLIIWIALYVLNAACAIGVLHTWRETEVTEARKRAGDAILAWLALACSCVGAAAWAL